MRGLACVLLLGVLTAQEPPAQLPAAPAPFDLDAAFAAALPPSAESLYTLVPWRRSLTEALAEAKRTGKPVFLYVNDGDMASGRC